jgi:hypothetical protein
MIALCWKKKFDLSATDWLELHELILSGESMIGGLIKLSRSTLVRLLSKNHHQYLHQLQDSLQNAKAKIHISTDMWSSPARRAHLAVCVRWLDDSYKLQKAVLSLPEIKHSHSGPAQAVPILDTLRNYGITTRIGYQCQKMNQIAIINEFRYQLP